MHSEDDFRNVYNPGKKTTQGMYSQNEPAAANNTKQVFAQPEHPKNATAPAAAFNQPADAKNATRQSLASINPANPTGLEPPPKDWQYEVPSQMRKPLIKEQMHNEDDLRNVYNPGKKTSMGMYVQQEPAHNATKAAN